MFRILFKKALSPKESSAVCLKRAWNSRQRFDSALSRHVKNSFRVVLMGRNQKTLRAHVSANVIVKRKKKWRRQIRANSSLPQIPIFFIKFQRKSSIGFWETLLTDKHTNKIDSWIRPVARVHIKFIKLSRLLDIVHLFIKILLECLKLSSRHKNKQVKLEFAITFDNLFPAPRQTFS